MSEDAATRLVITTHWEHSLPVVHLVGDLELETRAELERELDAACAIRGDVAVDLAGLRACDLSGFAPIVTAARSLHHRGNRLHLRHPPPIAVRLVDALDPTGAVSTDGTE